MISIDLLKGSLKTIVIKVLEDQGPMHGYLLTRRVEELTQGKIKLTYGAIYPVLHKLEKEKILITTRDMTSSRLRIYYALTPKGHNVVKEKINELNEFIDTLRRIVEPDPNISHA